MDKKRLEQLALRALGPLEELPYEQARERAEAKRIDVEVGLHQGEHFCVEVQYIFDSGRSGPVRILVSVDDGGRSAFMPVTRDTLIYRHR